MVTFTLDEFLELIARYNSTYWPVAVVAYLLAVLAVILAFRRSASASSVIAAILALLWLWVGVVFNGLVFPELSPFALLFAVLFAVQAILFTATGIYRGTLSFGVRADVYGLLGALAILYGAAGYPLVAYLLGRGYPQALLLGLVPCPTTTFTLGLLLWSARPLPKVLLAIPVVYAVAGGLLAASQGIVEDYVMVAFAVVAAAMIFYRDRRHEPALRLGGEGAA